MILTEYQEILTKRKDINFKALKEELLSHKKELIKEYEFYINEYNIECFNEIEKGINEKENIVYLVTLMLYSEKVDFLSILKEESYGFIIQNMCDTCETYTNDSYEKTIICKKLGEKWYNDNIQAWIDDNTI